MKTIHKYLLEITDKQLISTFLGYKILCVQIQNNKPYIWAEVDTEQPPIQRLIFVVGTGNPLPDEENLKYIGTVQMSPYVWHVYE